MIIGAVVKTNYKEKYATLLDTVNRIKREPMNASQLRKAIIGSGLYSEFLNDANSYLNYGYTFNPDYANSQADINLVSYLSKGYITFVEGGPEFENTLADSLDIVVKKELSDNNVSLSVPFYNEMFGKNIVNPTDPAFEEKDFYFYRYSNETVLNPVVRKVYKFHVSELHKASAPHDFMHISRDMYEDVVNWTDFQYGWVFDNVEQCYDIYKKLAPYGFYNCVTCFEAVYNTINIISIFSDVFNILFFVFMGVLVLIVVMHNRRIIKREQYRLGKSLEFEKAAELRDIIIELKGIKQ